MSGNVELNILKNPNKQQLTHNNNSSSSNNNKESPPFDIEKYCWKLDGDPKTRKYWTTETLSYVDRLFDTINRSPGKESGRTNALIQNKFSDSKKPDDFVWHLKEEACDIKELLNEIDQNTNTAGKDLFTVYCNIKVS